MGDVSLALGCADRPHPVATSQQAGKSHCPSPEGGGAFIGRLMKNGEEVMRQNVQEDFKPHTFKGYTVKYVNSYLEQQIKDLQTAYRRSKQ